MTRFASDVATVYVLLDILIVLPEEVGGLSIRFFISCSLSLSRSLIVLFG